MVDQQRRQAARPLRIIEGPVGDQSLTDNLSFGQNSTRRYTCCCSIRIWLMRNMSCPGPSSPTLALAAASARDGSAPAAARRGRR